MSVRIGLIGVGEAGAAIAAGPCDEHGLTDDAGIEPLMAEAGARRLQWFVDLDVTGGAADLDYDGVLRAVANARS